MPTIFTADTISNEIVKQHNSNIHLINCECQNICINTEEIHNFKFTNCNGNINISINQFSDISLFYNLKLDNPDLKIGYTLRVYDQIYLKDSAELIKLIDRANSSKIGLNFINCTFTNVKLILKNICSMAFNNCKGNLNFPGDKNDLHAIGEIVVINSKFENFNIQYSQIDIFDICKESIGEYRIEDSKIGIVRVEDKINYKLLQPVYFLPGIVFLLYILIHMGFWNLVNIFIFSVSYNLLFITKISKKVGDKLNYHKTIKDYMSLTCVLLSPLMTIIGSILLVYFDSAIIYEQLNITQYVKSDISLLVIFSFMIILNLFSMVIFARYYQKAFYKQSILTFIENQINLFEYKQTSSNSLVSYFINSKIGNDINIINSIIEESNFINCEGYDNKEKIYFMLEKNSFYSNKLDNFKQLKDDRLFNTYNFILENKQKLIMNPLNKESISKIYTTTKDDDKNYNYLFIAQYLILYLFYNLFIRIKNIMISMTLFYIIGCLFFNSVAMTITDPVTQIYIKEQKIITSSNGDKFYNDLSDKNTEIIVPDFYPKFSNSSYTIGKLIPLVENDDNKLFRANNDKTEFLNFLYNFIGLLHISALIFIVTNRFLSREKN